MSLCPNRRDAETHTSSPSPPRLHGNLSLTAGRPGSGHTSLSDRRPRVSNRASFSSWGAGAHYTFSDHEGIIHEKEPPSILRHGAVPPCRRFQNRILLRHHIFLQQKIWTSTDPHLWFRGTIRRMQPVRLGGTGF
ncbi:uncharacterized protein LY79DRAFT_538459 [Colletotrichum navitas]|uniref:Uncharacterized protein n=1 Tax=Colletotrichum navitas TaxID=681940 RepID=A0AAD8V9N9_9PEZI|nr:uncharacterized protein LY79DRAFT_538459 [Colletotrichum navitas]KAK1598189.1 hypothetical protein LY79DRAFT_538459 [Colletotrichum navitas]